MHPASKGCQSLHLRVLFMGLCVVFWQVHVTGNECISFVRVMELPKAGHSCCATLVIQEHRPYQSPAWDLQWMAQDIQTVDIVIVPGRMDCLSS